MTVRWRIRATAATLGLLVSLASAEAAGIERQRRAIGAVDTVRFDAAGELHIRQGLADTLVVQAEPRLLSRIRTESHAGTLSIRFDGPVQTAFPIRFELTVRSLVAVALAGSGDLVMPALNTPALRLALAGSGEARLGQLTARELRVSIDGSGRAGVESGQVDRQYVDISGAGDYDAAGLDGAQAVVTIPGSGEVRLRVSRRLDADIAGAGQVVYFGNPPQVREHIGGAGDVRRAAD
jgi:hypothetical protein